MADKKCPTAFDELKLAVSKLQTYVKKTKDIRDSLMGSKDVKKYLPFKIVPLAKLVAAYVATHVSDKKLQIFKEKNETEKKALLRAIDVIKTHYRLINRLEKGSEEEVSFALLARSTIEDYNLLLTEAKKPPHNLGERITHFFSDQTSFSIEKTCKVSLPKVAYVNSTNSEKAHCSAIDFFDTLPVPPKKEAVDLFRMKVIRNIQEKKLLSIEATLREVRSCPIDAVMNRTIQGGEKNNESIVSLKQTCIPLPGEKLVFSALYDQGQKTRGIPIGDITYHLTSQQTGFPDPALTSGLGLSETFIPSLPLRSEMAPTLDLLLDRKREVAFALLPQGALNQKAKLLYAEQKKLYEQDPSYFLTHHREVMEAIVKLLQGPEKTLSIVKQHYLELMETPPAYDQLPNPYRLLHNFYEETQEQIDHTFLTPQEVERLGDGETIQAYLRDNLEALFQTQIEGMEQKDPFTQILLQEFNKCSTSYFLQANSEKFTFPPPKLSFTEKRLQSIVFFQQIYFFQQLEKPQELLNDQEAITSLHFYFDNILGLIKGETPSPLSQLAHFLVEEVETYYQSRYEERV